MLTAERGYQTGQTRLRGHQLVGRVPCAWRRADHQTGQTLGKRVKTELGTQFQDRLHVHATHVRRRPIDVQRHVVDQPHQAPTDQGQVPALGDAFTALLARDLLDVCENFLQRAVLRQQLGRRFLTDPGNPRHIVGGVAPQRLKVHDLVGTNPPLLLHRLRIHHLVLADVVQLDLLVDQLPAVFVVRHQVAFAAQPPCFRADCGQHIVGFITGHRQHRDGQRVQESLDVGDLQLQIQRHGRPVHFVLIVDVVPKRLARRIKGTQQVVGLAPLQDVHDVA